MQGRGDASGDRDIPAPTRRKTAVSSRGRGSNAGAKRRRRWPRRATTQQPLHPPCRPLLQACQRRGTHVHTTTGWPVSPPAAPSRRLRRPFDDRLHAQNAVAIFAQPFVPDGQPFEPTLQHPTKQILFRDGCRDDCRNHTRRNQRGLRTCSSVSPPADGATRTGSPATTAAHTRAAKTRNANTPNHTSRPAARRLQPKSLGLKP